jgi:hypothetical protein
LLIILATQQDAHQWRSQTFRLFCPPLRSNSKDELKALRSFTQEKIAEVSKARAIHFITTSARHLVSSESDTSLFSDKVEGLIAIYQEAATLSYELGTQKTALKCSTLSDMGGLTFDPKSPRQVPHSLVQHDEDHDDHLIGKPITVIVHPLLEVYGTCEGEDYEKGRVLIPAEVWLENSLCRFLQHGTTTRS